MRKGGLLAVSLAAGVVAVGSATVGAQGQGQGQGADRTIVLYDKDDRSAFGFVDARPFTQFSRRRGPRRASPGDAFYRRAPQFSDRAGTTRVAAFRALCTATNRARRFDRIAFLCQGVYLFPDGTITVQGTFRGQPPLFAVTGGTGAYEAAGGQAQFEDLPGQDTRITIHLVGK